MKAIVDETARVWEQARTVSRGVEERARQAQNTYWNQACKTSTGSIVG